MNKPFLMALVLFLVLLYFGYSSNIPQPLIVNPVITPVEEVAPTLAPASTEIAVPSAASLSTPPSTTLPSLTNPPTTLPALTKRFAPPPPLSIPSVDQMSGTSQVPLPTPFSLKKQLLKNDEFCVAASDNQVTPGTDIILAQCDSKNPTQRWSYDPSNLSLRNEASSDPQTCFFISSDTKNISLAPCRFHDKQQQWSYTDGLLYSYAFPEFCVQPNQDRSLGSLQGGPCLPGNPAQSWRSL